MGDVACDHDVIVVGGGPAGATCARFLAKAGRRVALFEGGADPSTRRTSAGIFDHTWRALEQSPERFPYPMTAPHLFDFDTFADRKPLPDVVRFALPLTRRRVYFPNRYDLDTWLVDLARKEGARVAHGCQVRPADLSFEDGVYTVSVGGGAHRAPVLVGAAGTHCPVRRRFFAEHELRDDMMLLREVEAPMGCYSGPRHASYFDFIDKGVFAWTFGVGDEMIHIGSAVIKKEKSRREDLRYDDFIEHLTKQGYLARDFDPEAHHVTGGQIRMFSSGPMTMHDGNCRIIGDSAGLLQTDAYNGITNAIVSGKNCARDLVSGASSKDPRRQLSRFLFQDVAKDMLSAPLRALRGPRH